MFGDDNFLAELNMSIDENYKTFKSLKLFKD